MPRKYYLYYMQRILFKHIINTPAYLFKKALVLDN